MEWLYHTEIYPTVTVAGQTQGNFSQVVINVKSGNVPSPETSKVVLTAVNTSAPNFRIILYQIPMQKTVLKKSGNHTGTDPISMAV